MKGELLFLGSGASMGVPHIGCNCPVCTSSHSMNKRLRPSLLFTCNGKKFLIDATPDFRYQALKYNVTHIDGIMITHTHYDHVSGLDELRVYNIHEKRPISCLLSHESLEELKIRYSYLFLKNDPNITLRVEMDVQKLEDEYGKVIFQQIPIQYVSYKQGSMKVTGYRFGDTAYITDISEYNDHLFTVLKGITTLIISAPRKEGSSMHLSLENVLKIAEKLKVKKAYISHLCHEMDYQATSAMLPDYAELAYDGLRLACEIE